jgi:putative peptidoglycan lipid II flippase
MPVGSRAGKRGVQRLVARFWNEAWHGVDLVPAPGGWRTGIISCARRRRPDYWSGMSKDVSLQRIGVVAGSTLLSRVLGLVRDSLTAAFFGTTVWNSAFQFAFMLPNLFRRLLAEGQLMAAFVPTLAEENEQNGRPGVFVLLNKVATWLFLVSGGLAVLAIVGLGVAAVWMPDLAERYVLGVKLAQLLFPYLVFVCLAAALSAVLQLLGHFSIPALTAVWLNLTIIVALGGGGGFLAKTPAGQMGWLCGGVLFGGLLQLLIPWRVLRREGWRARWDTRPSPRLWEMLRLMAPGIVGTAIYQINFLVSRSLAFALNESAVSVLTLANRVMEVPQGIFTVSVATVVFPLIATYAARREMDNLAAAYWKGMRLICLITIPAAVGLVLLGEPIVRLLFQHGAFTAEDTRQTAPVLAVFALGLPLYSWVTQAIRGCYAMKDTVMPVKIAAVSFAVNLVASLLLMRWLSTAGLAWAGNLASVVQAVLLQWALARKVPTLRARVLWPSLLKIVLATAAMALAIMAARWGVRCWAPAVRVADLAAVAGIIPVAVAVYGFVLWALRIEERDELLGLAQKMLARVGIPLGPRGR